MILRFADRDGRLNAIEIDALALARQIARSAPDSISLMPDFIKVSLNGALFGLRHGPAKRWFKQNGVDYDEMMKECGGDPNGATLLMLSTYYLMRITQEVGTKPVDITQDDLTEIFSGQVFKRRPDLDGYIIPEAEEHAAIAEPEGQAISAEPVAETAL